MEGERRHRDAGVPEQYHVRARDGEECALLAINKATCNDVIAALPEENDIITTNILAQYGLNKEGEDSGGAGAGGDDDAFAAIQEAIKAALKQTQDRSLEQLTYAASEGDLETVEMLVARGCPLNTGDYDQRTPLHVAVSQGQKAVAQLLLDRGAKHSPLDRWGAHPLKDALAINQLDIAEILIDKGAHLSADQYAIVREAAVANLSKLQCVVLKGGANANIADCDSRTLLHSAATLGDFTMVQNLIAVGADPHAKDRWGGTPIEDAIKNSQALITAFLALQGARASAKYQQEALFYAAQVGSVRLINILAESGANLGSQNYDKISAVHVAASENNVAAVAAILSKKFTDVNIKDKWGRTPLDYAIANRSWPCVTWLVALGGIITDPNGRETIAAAKAANRLPGLHQLWHSLNHVNESQQPDAAALGALYGVKSAEGATLALVQQRNLLSQNLKALEGLRGASVDISTAFADVLAIATVLNEVLSVAAPAKGLTKSLTRTASMKAKPRKDLTKALMPVLMRSTAVQEACRHLREVIQLATLASADKDSQMARLCTAAGMRVEQLSVDAGQPLHVSFAACFTGPSGAEELDDLACLSCPVFRRNIEEATFSLLCNATYEPHEVPLAIKLATCMRWSDELWNAMAPGGTTFEFATVAPQIWQVLRTLSLDHLWTTLSKLLEERHDSLDRATFPYVFFTWLSMSEQVGSDDGMADDAGSNSFSRGFSGFSIHSDHEEDADDDTDDAAGPQQLARLDDDEDNEPQSEEAIVRWVSLLHQAERAAAMPAAAHKAVSEGDAPAEQKAAAATEDDRAWLEALIASAGPSRALATLLHLTIRERLAAFIGIDISNIDKGRRIFEKVNQSKSGVLPPLVLDVLASSFAQELRFNRHAQDLVEKYLDANNPLRKEDFDALFVRLSSPGDDAKLPLDAPNWVLHPNSRWLRYWNRFIMALGVYFFWEVPVSIAFRPEVTFGIGFLFMSRVLELFFFLEIASNFARAFYSDNGTLIYTPSKIRRAYMSQWWFIADIIAFTPFSFLRVIDSNGDEHHVGAWLRLPRLIAVARVLLYRRDGKNLFSHNAANNNGDVSAKAMFRRIMMLLLGVTCLTHLMACCWWYIGTLGEPRNMYDFELKYGEFDYENRPKHWVYFYHGLGYSHIWDETVSVVVQYYFSFYWTASTLSTSGLVGETTPKNLREIAFTIVCMLATITVWAYVMGEISNLVMSSSERLVLLREKVQLVQTFLQKRRLTRTLANDIVTVFYEKLQTNDDTASVFSSLSSSLMFEVAMHLSLPLVKSIEIFSECSSSFVASISVLLREKQLASDETLFALGDAATSLHVVASSSITLTVPGIGDEDVECGRLGPGSMVGDTAFFFRLRHVNSAIVGAKAATLFVLSRQDYDQLCSSYVHDSELVMKKMVDSVNGGGKVGASQASSNNEMPDNVRRTLHLAVKRQTETATLTFIEAASNGDVQTVRDMVEAGRVHVDDSDYDARTALHLAASNNHMDLVQTLLNDLGASIAPRDRLLGTPLDDAVRHRRFEIVRYLASTHAHHIEVTPAYIDRWMQAAADDDLELVQVLLLAGMNCNIANSDNRTALHTAVCKRSFRVVKHLLNLGDLELGSIDRMGSTPMWDALVACDAEMCQLLADKNAPVQEETAHYMCSAAAEDNATFIDLACKHDVNILCRDLFGRTPLHVAASAGALRCVDAMARKLEAKVNTIDVFGATPLDNAIQADDAVSIAILRQAGCLQGDDPSLSQAHADLKAWADADRQARRAKHLQSVAAHLPESKLGRDCAAVAQALTAFVRVMYSNTNIYTAALHETARQHMEAKKGQGASQARDGSTSAESRVKAALAAIVSSLSELRDVMSTRPKPYAVVEHALLRKVSHQGVKMLKQIHEIQASLDKVIDYAGKVLVTLEHRGMRLQTFAVQRLISMLSRGIWTHLNINVPNCVLQMSDDELSYVQRWDRSVVQQYMAEKLVKRVAVRKQPADAHDAAKTAAAPDAPQGERKLARGLAKADRAPSEGDE